MTWKNRVFIAVLLLLCVGVLAYAFFGAGSGVDTPVVILPTEAPSPAQTGSEPEDDLVADVSPETVQAVLSTLHRAESWRRIITVEDYWDGGSSVTQLEAASRAGAVRIRFTGEGRNILVSDGTVHIWYDGEDGVFSAPEGSGTDADRYMRCITYEELLSLPVGEITAAGYGEHNGEPCIRVEHRTEALGYRSVVYVSVATGLLCGEETYDGDTLIYRMSAGETDTSAPDEALFELPS